MPQARGLHHGLLGPQGGGGGEVRDRGRSVQLAARQGRAGGGGRVAGHGEQGPGHGAGDGGPGAGGDLLVDADQFDGLQAGRVGGLGAHVRQRRQGLGDQEPGVAAGAPHGAVGRGAGGLGHVGALRQERQGVGGRAQGEQHIGAGVGVRDGEDIEGVDELARLLRGGHRQGEPVADRPGVQQASPLLGSCAPGAGSVAVEHLVLLLSWAGLRRWWGPAVPQGYPARRVAAARTGTARPVRAVPGLPVRVPRPAGSAGPGQPSRVSPPRAWSDRPTQPGSRAPPGAPCARVHAPGAWDREPQSDTVSGLPVGLLPGGGPRVGRSP